MKTPDEIKKGLECCDCKTCPYDDDCMTYDECLMAIGSDALAYIQQLEAANAELLTKCERLERERDAAVADIRNSLNCCKFCKHDDGMHCKSDPKPIDRSCFEWRGVKEE